jgi:Rrf2 family transcriptional regulator, iron-sulfur cluster assembly transcription factor
MFSRSTQYAIRAMTFLAAQRPGRLCGAREIAQAEGIPRPFLWKILQKLAARKLIRSVRGVRGGYELAKPADRITLEKILKEIGQHRRVTRCILGFSQCTDRSPCVLHPLWSTQRKSFSKALQTTTLADLTRAARAASSRSRVTSIASA